jgi:hypothetical protein
MADAPSRTIASGESLKLIHDQPDKHWSLEELGVRLLACQGPASPPSSRSWLAIPPWTTSTEWRMSLAYSRSATDERYGAWLSHSTSAISQSPPSRSAFKKAIGKSPVEVRKDYRASIEAA